MAVKKRLDLLKELYHQFGFFVTLDIFFKGIRYMGCNRMILFALTQPKPQKKAIESSRTHTFKFATEEDLKGLSVVEKYNIGEIDVERVRNGTAKCLLQLDGDKLAGYAWIWTHRLAYIAQGYHLNLPNDTIYNYKGYTDPDYRGDGFQALRHVKLLELLKDEGVSRLFGFVDHFNVRSLNGVKKSGYKKVGELVIRHNRKNKQVNMKLVLDENFWAQEART